MTKAFIATIGNVAEISAAILLSFYFLHFIARLL